MIFGVTYIQWLFIAFFIVISTMLVINILIINKLKDDKNQLVENEKLLTGLLAQIQNYFSKIDNNITTVANEEQQFHKMFDMHQKDEDVILKAMEVNQTLFLDRMDKIVNIQQSLSQQIKIMIDQEKGSSITPEMIRMAETFMSVQKRDMSHVKNRLDSIQAINEAINYSVDGSHLDSGTLHTILKENLSHHLHDVQQYIQKVKNDFVSTDNDSKSMDEAMANIEVVNKYIDIAKQNIQNVIEQSIDLNPIYKSVHELVEQIKIIFSDYHLAKGEIEKLLQTLQTHEHKDLLDLKAEVEHFLKDIKEEIKSSVEMLKKEYHLGQKEVTGTVKTLADRSVASSAYQEHLE